MYDKCIKKTGRNFKINPKQAQVLKDAGINCVTLANNHIRDFGGQGVRDTLQVCHESGLDTVGAGRDSEIAAAPLRTDIGGWKIVFLNYCEREFNIANTDLPGANPFDFIDSFNQIQKIRSQVDKLIVIYHGGIEYVHYPTPPMVKLFRFLADLGVDAIIAHHSHAYSSYEIRQGKALFYGLGNLYALSMVKQKKYDWFTGALAVIDFYPEHSEFTLQPIITHSDYSQVRLANQIEQIDFQKHQQELACQVQNPVILESLWQKIFQNRQEYLIRLLQSRHRIEYAILKRLKITQRTLPRMKQRVLLNLLRCMSLNYWATSTLESIELVEDVKQRK